MIRFVNLFNMPSGRFTLQILGFEYFKGSRLFAFTFCNLRILIGKKRKPLPAPENHHIYTGDGGAPIKTTYEY